MTLVKICGVSEVAHARAAAALGADFVGMVFAPSRRQVTLGQAKRIASGLRNDGEPASDRGDADTLEGELARRRPLLVGVFADQDTDTINAICDDVGLDLVQLSGSEPWEACAHIRRPIFKRMKVRDGETAEQLMVHVHADRGRFGPYGGASVSDTPMAALGELEREYASELASATFQEELASRLCDYVGRPAPRYFAHRLSERLGCARIYLRRVSLAHR